MNNIETELISNLIDKINKGGSNIQTLSTAIYARKSTVDKSEVSIESQIDFCKKYIATDKRLNIVNIYSDEDKSGYFIDYRPGFQKLLEDVRSGKIKVVVCYSTSRLVRDTASGSLLDKEFRKLNVIDLYATQSFSDDSQGHFMKNIVRAFDQKAPEDTSESVIKSCFSAAEQGKFLGGKVPFGYSIEKKVLIINESEAEIVREIFANAALGKTISEISDALDSKGYKNRVGKCFPANSIWTILQNEKYTGTYIYNKNGGRKRKNRVSTKEFNEIRIENLIPQIVDKSTFSRAQKILNKKSSRNSPLNKNKYPLSGLLVCGDSGKLLHGETITGSSGKKYSIYSSPRGNQSKISIHKDDIELATAKLIVDILNKISKTKFVRSNLIKSFKENIQNEITSANTRLSCIEQQHQSLVEALSKTNDKLALKSINKSITDCTSKIEELNSEIELLQQEQTKVKQFIDDMRNGLVKISVNDILSNTELFTKLSYTFITNITIYKDTCVFNLVDLQ